MTLKMAAKRSDHFEFKKGHTMTHKRGRILRMGMFLLVLTLLSGGFGQANAQGQQTPGRLITTNYVDNVGGLFEFNTDDSNPVFLTPYLLQGARGQDGTPSVSSDGKLIAFASVRNTIGQGDRHIWLMNGDGTNAHALTTGGTLSNGDPIRDRSPVISPDGKKIAFISNRYVYTFPNDFPYNGAKVAFNDVYVINTDGTGFHQVTQTEPNTFSNGVAGSDVGSVAWGPDSSKLVFRGLRLVTVSNQVGYHAGLFFINADGTGESNYAILDSTGQHAAVDWSPDGRYITTPYGAEAQGAGPYRILIYDLVGSNNRTLFSGASNIETSAPGTIRFSPDSSRIVFLTTTNYLTDNPTISNLDGTNVTTLTTALGRGTWLWWQSGAAVPTPAKLTLSYNIPPDLLLLFTGQPGVQVVPKLYDAQGNVIVHAVGNWDPDTHSQFTIDANGIVTGRFTQQNGPLTLTASNGGITSNTLKVLVNLPSIQIKLLQISGNNNTTRTDIAIANTGAGGATNVSITSMTLDGVAANESLPFYFGNVPTGLQSQDLVFTYPKSGKPSGTTVLLKVKGTYDYYGSFSTTLRVQLP